MGVIPHNQGGICNSTNCMRCLQNQDQFCTNFNNLRENQGGFQSKVRVSSTLVCVIPESIPSDLAAPFMCAGLSVWSPLIKNQVGTLRKKVAVVGIGGLGHFAIQFATKLGATVVAISSSTEKRNDALALGCSDFFITDDICKLQDKFSSFDVIINTVSGDLDFDLLLNLLSIDGIWLQVGSPFGKITFNASSICFKRINFTGSVLGSRKDCIDMLEFSAKHKITPWIEKFKMSDVNTAISKVVSNKVRYRVVLEN